MKSKLAALIAAFTKAFDETILHKSVRVDQSEIDGGVNLHAEGVVELSLRYSTPGEFIKGNGGEIGEDFLKEDLVKDISIFTDDISSPSFSVDGFKTITTELNEEQARRLGIDLAEQVNLIASTIVIFAARKGQSA